MSLKRNNGTTKTEIGKLYRNNGTTKTQIGKAYRNNGTVSSLIYTAETVLLGNGINLMGTPVFTKRRWQAWASGNFIQNEDGTFSMKISEAGNDWTTYDYKFPNTIPTNGAKQLVIVFKIIGEKTSRAFYMDGWSYGPNFTIEDNVWNTVTADISSLGQISNFKYWAHISYASNTEVIFKEIKLV